MRNAFMMLLLLLAPLSVHADVIFNLDNPIQTSLPGGTVTFTGTLFNNDTVDVFLNGASADLPYAELSVDFTDFFTLVPLSLSAGGSYSGPILDVDVTNAAVPGDYFGSFTIQGGADGAAIDDLATENFQVTVAEAVTTVPEPSTVILLASALLGLVLFQQRLA